MKKVSKYHQYVFSNINELHMVFLYVSPHMYNLGKGNNSVLGLWEETKNNTYHSCTYI